MSRFFVSIPASFARAYRNTLVASSFIEQNKSLKASFQHSAVRPALTWLSVMAVFAAAWVVTGLHPNVNIKYHIIIHASMIGCLSFHGMTLSIILWLRRREALLTLKRFRTNQIMHRIFETAESCNSGCTGAKASFATGIAQSNGDPYVIRHYTLDDIIFWFANNAINAVIMRNDHFTVGAINAVIMRNDHTSSQYNLMHEFVHFADMFAAVNAVNSANSESTTTRDCQC